MKAYNQWIVNELTKEELARFVEYIELLAEIDNRAEEGSSELNQPKG